MCSEFGMLITDVERERVKSWMKDDYKLWCMCDNNSEVFEEIKFHHYRYHENVVWWTWMWGFELLLEQNISPQIMQTLAFIHLLKYWKKPTNIKDRFLSAVSKI